MWQLFGRSFVFNKTNSLICTTWKVTATLDWHKPKLILPVDFKLSSNKFNQNISSTFRDETYRETDANFSLVAFCAKDIQTLMPNGNFK
jgi:hypothetical protein